jgi:hypothetical protein
VTVLRLFRQFAVPRRTVIAALTGQTPPAAHGERTGRHSPKLQPIAGRLDGLIAARPDATTSSICRKIRQETQVNAGDGVIRGSCSSQLVRSSRARHTIDRSTDPINAGIVRPAVDTTPVVTDLHTAGVGVDGGNQMQVRRSRNPNQDDVPDFHRGRIDWSDGHQLTATDQWDHGGTARAKLDHASFGNSCSVCFQGSH